MLNRLTLSQKAMIGFSLPLLLIIINSMMFIIITQKQQHFMTATLQKEMQSHQTQAQLEEQIDRFNKMAQSNQILILCQTLISVLLAIMTAFLIVRSLNLTEHREAGGPTRTP